MATANWAPGKPKRLARHYAGTEYLLLGLVARARYRSPDPLADLGADRASVATAVLHMHSGGDPDRREQLRAFLASELTAVLEESERPHAEVEHLRLLRHGVEPDDGAARSA